MLRRNQWSRHATAAAMLNTLTCAGWTPWFGLVALLLERNTTLVADDRVVEDTGRFAHLRAKEKEKENQLQVT